MFLGTQLLKAGIVPYNHTVIFVTESFDFKSIALHHIYVFIARISHLVVRGSLLGDICELMVVLSIWLHFTVYTLLLL